MRVLKRQCVSLRAVAWGVVASRGQGSAVGVVCGEVLVMLPWWGAGVDGMVLSVVLCENSC